MLKIYGSMRCGDCVACARELRAAGIAFEFLDIDGALGVLKEFLALRDTHAVFAPLRGTATIGIPCIVDGDRVLLDWSIYVGQTGV